MSTSKIFSVSKEFMNLNQYTIDTRDDIGEISIGQIMKCLQEYFRVLRVYLNNIREILKNRKKENTMK